MSGKSSLTDFISSKNSALQGAVDAAELNEFLLVSKDIEMVRKVTDMSQVSM